MIKLTLATTLLIFIIHLAVFSQDVSESDIYRPKIGLVLSGGGAKGMAHVGVLKVLEELKIKPDYITGTSMGSIMGGLYAIGYNANQLDSIIKQVDWDKMLSDNIPLSKVVPEEKYDYRRYLFQFDLTRKGPVLPSGVVVGQGITEELNYLTWDVAGINDFDDFPIPFRCVASDLISGEPFIFNSGSLSTAMRSSMAIPSVFSPVVLDNMLLVDGGVLDNLPVKACRDMGADIIIAVNVGVKGKPKIDDFKSIGDVLMGAAMIRSNYEANKSLRYIDILIEPDLEGYGNASFNDGADIIELGEIAALKSYVELSGLADYLNQFPCEKKPQINPLKQDVFIEDIKVVGLKRLNKNFILGKFGLKKGHRYTRKDIDEGLHFLIGTRYVDNVNYKLMDGNQGYILVLEPIEAFPSKYNFSIHYNDVYKASAIFNVAMRNYVLNGSSFKFTFELSEYPRLYAEFVDHFGQKQSTGYYANAHWERNFIPYIDDSGNKLGSFNQTYGEAQFGLFFSPDIKRILKVGGFFKRTMDNSGSGVLDLIIDDVNRIGSQAWGFNLKYDKNSLNKQFFADRGMKFNFNLEYPIEVSSIYQGSDNSLEILEDIVDIPNKSYLKLDISIKQYLPLNSHLNLSYFASIGGASKDLGSSQYFSIGGTNSTTRANDIPFVGLLAKEVSAQQYVLGNINLRYEPISNLYIGIDANVMDYKTNFDELSFAPTELFGSDETIISGGVSISYNSILGPVNLGYGRSNLNNQNRIYFSVGFPF